MSDPANRLLGLQRIPCVKLRFGKLASREAPMTVVADRLRLADHDSPRKHLPLEPHGASVAQIPLSFVHGVPFLCGASDIRLLNFTRGVVGGEKFGNVLLQRDSQDLALSRIHDGIGSGFGGLSFDQLWTKLKRDSLDRIRQL